MNSTARTARRVVALGAVAALGATLVACSGEAGVDESSPGELSVYVTSHAWTETLLSHLGEYEAETGIKVNITQLEQQQLEDQTSVRLNAGSTDIDVLMYRPQQVTVLYGQNGYLADLNGYIGSSSEWDWQDFVPAAQELV